MYLSTPLRPLTIIASGHPDLSRIGELPPIDLDEADHAEAPGRTVMTASWEDSPENGETMAANPAGAASQAAIESRRHPVDRHAVGAGAVVFEAVANRRTSGWRCFHCFGEDAELGQGPR